MKRFVRFIGLLVLITFSFFYSDRVASVISSKDSFMIRLNEIKDSYNMDSISGIVSDKTIIPGISGKKINIDKSYKRIKEVGNFSLDLLVYDYIEPSNSLSKNNDKYIIHGNSKKNMVSIVFLLDNDRYFDKLNSIVKDKNIIINFFVNYNYLISNSTSIASFVNGEFYSYGDNGKYTPDDLIFANNLLTRITKNEAKYCLVKEYNDDVLSLCSRNNLYTVLPNIVVKSDPYMNIKNQIDSGSIILMELNNSNIIELPVIIDYIKGKGFSVVGLSELLSE